MNKDWREKFYAAYATTASSDEYTWSLKEYEIFAKTNAYVYKAFLPKDKDARILDIACGAGHFLYFLQKKAGYRNAGGIDISKEQIQLAKEAGIENLHLGDYISYLKEYPNTFDTITAHHFIEHLTKNEVMNFLDSIISGLKPDGRIIVSTGNVASLFGATHICADFTHEGGFTPRSMRQVLLAMGFKDVSVRGIPPVPHDFKSRIRIMLWKVMRKMLQLYLGIERGGLMNSESYIVELNLFGTGLKK